MNDASKMWDKLDLAKRIVVFSASLSLSLWLVIRFVAIGMFGLQHGVTWKTFWVESLLWAAGGGCVCGLLWGGSSLRKICWLAVPGGMWLALMLATSPFVIYESLASSEPELARNLLGYLSGIVLFFCIACLPVLGPSLSHAIWNQKSWSEIQEALREDWRDFWNTFRSVNGQRPHSVTVFDRLSPAYRVIAIVLWLGFTLWLLKR